MPSARPPLSGECLGRLSDDLLVYRLRKPTVDGRTELLLTRLFECLPLVCPHCGEPMRIIVFVLHPPVIERMESLRDPAFGDDCGISGSR